MFKADKYRAAIYSQKTRFQKGLSSWGCLHKVDAVVKRVTCRTQENVHSNTYEYVQMLVIQSKIDVL